MSDQTVFISSRNTATFRCPQCGQSKTVDVSPYATAGKKVTVTCTCACGHRFRCRLENRRQYRKGVDLPGRFTLLGEGGTKDTGLVRVVDLSATGLQMQLTVARSFTVGAELIIEFRLDDNKRTPMRKRVIVRNIRGQSVGASFHPNELDDPALGFYLLP